MRAPSKILVFRQSSLGDVVLTLPVLDRLKETFQDCQIDYLVKSFYADIPRAHPAVSTVHSFDDNNPFEKTIAGLRAQKYDYIIDLQANLRSLALRTMLFSAKFFQYKKRRLAREMIVRRAEQKLSVEHTVMAYQAALTRLGIQPKFSAPVMRLRQEDLQFAEDFLKGLKGAKRPISFCPGARHFEKRWPADSFCQVALKLLDDPSESIVVFSAENDEFEPDLGIQHERLMAAKGLELPQIAALLSRCHLALTNDSGLMHLANAVGTPVLAIFGPTNPRLGFAPTLAGSEIICDDVHCSPCSVHGQKPCYQPVKYCFEAISPQRVAARISGMSPK